MSRTRRDSVEMSCGQPNFNKTTHLENVAALVGDEQDVELLEWLVDESDIGGLNGGMLGIGRDEFGERSEQTIDMRSGDGTELSGEECWGSAVWVGGTHVSHSACRRRRRGRPGVSGVHAWYSP